MIIDLILLINKPKVLWPWRAIIFSAEVGQKARRERIPPRILLNSIKEKRKCQK